MLDLTKDEIATLYQAHCNELLREGATLAAAAQDALSRKLMTAYVRLHTATPARQTQADTLTHEESMAAYKAVANRFGLKGSQRSALDASSYYSRILGYAHVGDWQHCETALYGAGILK